MTRVGWGRFALVGFLWGTPYLFIKVAVEEISPSTIIFFRVLIGAMVLLPLALMQKKIRIPRKYWHIVLIYTVAELIGPWYLITNAEQKISSGLAGLLVATVPIWAAIFASMTGDHTVWHKTRLFGLIIGFMGVVAVVGIESIRHRSSSTSHRGAGTVPGLWSSTYASIRVRWRGSVYHQVRGDPARSWVPRGGGRSQESRPVLGRCRSSHAGWRHWMMGSACSRTSAPSRSKGGSLPP